MLSVSEYTTFCEMMSHYKQHQKDEAEKKAEDEKKAEEWDN